MGAERGKTRSKAIHRQFIQPYKIVIVEKEYNVLLLR